MDKSSTGKLVPSFDVIKWVEGRGKQHNQELQGQLKRVRYYHNAFKTLVKDSAAARKKVGGLKFGTQNKVLLRLASRLLPFTIPSLINLAMSLDEHHQVSALRDIERLAVLAFIAGTCDHQGKNIGKKISNSKQLGQARGHKTKGVQQKMSELDKRIHAERDWQRTGNWKLAGIIHESMNSPKSPSQNAIYKRIVELKKGANCAKLSF